jgi:hypothetical protein
MLSIKFRPGLVIVLLTVSSTPIRQPVYHILYYVARFTSQLGIGVIVHF